MREGRNCSNLHTGPAKHNWPADRKVYAGSRTGPSTSRMSGSERIADASVSIKAESVAIAPKDLLIETESVRFCRGAAASGPPGVSIRLANARTSAVSVGFSAAKLE